MRSEVRPRAPMPHDDANPVSAPTRRQHVVPVLGGAIAMALLMALLAALLIAHGFSRPTAGAAVTAAPHVVTVPPAVPSATATPSGPQWQPLATYAQTNGLVLAPSDPRIAFQFAIVTTSKFNGSLLFQGTQDQGLTWHDIAPPAAVQGLNSQDFAIPLGLAVSPLDPNTLYLTITARMTNCPSGTGAVPASEVSFTSSQYCTVQYYSRDAGASWHTLTLPSNDLLGSLSAQGSRLWGMVGPPFTAQDTTAPTGHLARSDDGVTWTLADGSLPNSVGIALYAPAAASHAVFVVSDRADRFNSQVCGGCLPPADFKVWRSDNAGASWTQVSTLPYHDVNDGVSNLLVTSDASALYLTVYTATSRGAVAFTSGDGGRTWSAAPTSGIDPSAPQLNALWGVLADGSVIATYSPAGDAYADTTHAFYAWKPGAARWRALGAPLPSSFPLHLFVSAPAADGSQTLTLQYQDTDSQPVVTLTVK